MDKIKHLFKTVIICVALLAIGGQAYSVSADATTGSQKATSQLNWKKFAGVWEGNNDYEIMKLGLVINTATETVYGWHKAIASDGNRADMVSEDTISIDGSFANGAAGGVLKVSFTSGHNPNDRGTGEARITLINDNTIKWEVISREGVSYIPSEMELRKVAQATNAPVHVLFRNAWSVIDPETKRQFSLERSIEEVVSALGEPQSRSLFLDAESASGNIYHYAGIDILAQDTPDGSISYIYISSDKFITPGDLKVGDSLEEVVGIYGQVEKARKSENLEWHTYVLDGKKGIRTSFGIGIDDRLVKIIRITMLHSPKQDGKRLLTRSYHI